MRTPALTCLLCSVALITGGAAHSDDVDGVKERLFQAKKTYDGEIQKFRTAVSEALDKRESDARKAGDKKAVDKVKEVRERFEKGGELPAGLPPAVQAQAAAARTVLDTAYSEAVKSYVRLKEDATADVAEKERQEFLIASAHLSNKRTYVSSLKPFDVVAWNGWFEKDSAKYKMGDFTIAHSVFMHPNFKGDASASYTRPARAYALRATVGVPKHAADQGDPASPLTFEILGDGKSLWKSEPVARLDTFQTCTVKVEKVKTLTLRVHCPEAHGGAHAVWFAPVLVE